MIGLELIVKTKNLEFKQIAQSLDISPQTVSDWIKGKRKVPEKRLKQLSELFNLDQELIGKALTEEEKLRLYYQLSSFDTTKYNQNMKKFKEDGTAMGQLRLEYGEIRDTEPIYTISELEERTKMERRKIKIKEADIMISQLKEMYHERKVIDVHPEFQRVFRWSQNQKSKFIESILLGIPIPPIFVAEDSNLNWDVIDGVQRLSTIFEFLGILKDDNGKLLKPTTLVATKILKELDGKIWNDKTGSHKFTFQENKYLTNAFLNATLKIIKVDAESDEKVKYDIFDRLNTGGSKLSDQEIRNCMAIMLNREFYRWLRSLSYNFDFKKCIPLSEKSINEQDDLEYVLRFIVYRNIDKKSLVLSEDIGEMLTEEMRKFCNEKELDLKRETDIFNKTFELLSKSVGENVFKNYYLEEDIFKGVVKISNFEIIAIGVANNLSEILDRDEPIEYLRKKIKDLYSDKRYLKLQGDKIASQRAVTRFSKLSDFGTEYFNNKYDIKK